MDSTDWLQPTTSTSCTGWLLLQTTVIVIGSSFQFGYNTGVINAPQTYIESFINESHQDRFGEYINKSSLTILWSSTVAIFAVGGMVGSVSAGPLSQKLGPKISLLCNNCVALAGACLMGFSKLANSYEMLMVGRFVIGANCGINTVIAPMFLTEISPVQHRGMLGTLNQLGIVSSILISQVLGLPSVLGNESGWPILLGLTAVFAVFQLIVLPFCPESPRYLLLYKDNEKAAKSGLRKLRGPYSDIDEECSVMLEEHRESSKEKSIGFVEIFRIGHLRRPLLIAIVMQLSQQFSGINAVFYYSTSLFIDAGVDESNSALTTVGVGAVNIVMTIVSLLLIERAGRRLLHLVGLGGMFASSVLLAITLTVDGGSWLTGASLAGVFLFVAFFQVGPGSIPWFITAELFTQGPRPTAISIAGLVNWAGNFAIALSYPPLQGLIEGYTFLIFAGLLAVFFLYTFFKVPETKGKTIQEITARFQKSITQYDDNKKYYNHSTKL